MYYECKKKIFEAEKGEQVKFPEESNLKENSSTVFLH